LGPYRLLESAVKKRLLLAAGWTFSTNQELVIVPEVRDKVLDAWGIDAGVRVGEFSREQSAYLDYYRANVFKHQLLGR
jgi:uncharacterized protein YjiK